MDMLDRMLGHDAWATELLFEHCADLSNKQLTQSFDIGHGTILATLGHLVDVVDFWSSQIEQRDFQIADVTEFAVVELAEIHTQLHAQFSAAARRARDEGRLDDLFTDTHGYPQSIGGTVLHLIYHNVIHRSEARHMLQRLGIADVWDGDPQEWEYGMRERGHFA